MAAATRWRRLTPYAVGVVVTFAAYPFVAFLNHNREELTELTLLVTYAAVVLLVALAVLVAIVFLRPRASADHVAVGVAIFLASFFGFSMVFAADPRAGRQGQQLVAWTLVTLLLVVVGSRFARLAPVRTFILVFGLALTLVPLGEYLTWRFTAEPAQAGSAATSPVTPADVVSTPNVYLFLLDEYGRSDALREILGYDNTAFYQDLRDRNFVVNDDVHAPFQQTIPSMASVLDMDYIITEEDGADQIMWAANRLRGENATVAYFKSLGYDYVYSTPGLFTWNRCVGEQVDLCIDPLGKGLYLSEMERSLLDLTPVGAFDLAREAVTDPAYVMAELDEHRDEIEEPFFLYSHVLSPHWPFRYTADCDLRAHFGYTDHLLDKSDFDRERYAQDVGCLNERVVEGVDRILETDPDAIVIVMSDHGSKFIPDGAKRLEKWSPQAIREELGVLYAMHVPDRCRRSVEENTNSVNTFRIVAACLEDRPPDYLEDRAFIWPAFGTGPQEIEDLSVLDPAP